MSLALPSNLASVLGFLTVISVFVGVVVMLLNHRQIKNTSLERKNIEIDIHKKIHEVEVAQRKNTDDSKTAFNTKLAELESKLISEFRSETAAIKAAMDRSLDSIIALMHPTPPSGPILPTAQPSATSATSSASK